MKVHPAADGRDEGGTKSGTISRTMGQGDRSHKSYISSGQDHRLHMQGVYIDLVVIDR